MFKSKKLVALGLAAVALFSTVGVSLAYWANSFTGNNDSATGTVNVGDGVAVTSTVSVADATAGKKLVPADWAVDGYNDDNEVAQADISFSVTWTSSNPAAVDGVPSTLTLTQTSKKAYNSADTDVTASVGSLYVVTYPTGTITINADSTITVHVYVTLTEPDVSQVSNIFNGSLELGITFTVADIVLS